MTREEHIAQVMQRPAPLEVICEYPPESDPIPVAQRQHQIDPAQWRGMSMYLYEPDSFAPLARLEQTLEEPARITLGPDGEFTEHPVKTRHATYFYQNDHLGTPQELVDEEGEIVWLGKYRAWGELRSATQQNGQPAKIRNALRFQGQYCDDETGLHYNLNRYYDPASGRFINKDPIGLGGGINVFRYASNPVEWIDPTGLVNLRAGDPAFGSLTNTQTRCWYKREIGKIKDQICVCKSKKDQSRLANKLRNEARIRARLLMQDREAAVGLYTGASTRSGKPDPMLTWSQAVAKAKGKGYKEDEAYDYVITASQRSRASVDEDTIGGVDCDKVLRDAGI